LKKTSRGSFIKAASSAALLGAIGTTPAVARRRSAQNAAALPGGVRPNIVTVMCDDLNIPTVEALDSVQRIMGDAGIEFTNGFVTTPLCTPSRSSYLTGRYAHNHGVWVNSNAAGEMGYDIVKRQGIEDSTFASWLHDAGYHTSHVGKYINGYNELRIPPGWDDWFTWLGHGSESDRVNDNGTEIPVSGNTTDRAAVKVQRILNERNADPMTPFLLCVAPHPPHNPPEVRSQDRDRFGSLPLPKGPNFNERDISDKPNWLRSYDLLTERDINRLEDVHRNRTRSMLPVIELLAGIVATLRENGQLESTYIFFYSDNGYHIGNHRMPRGKLAPYDEDIRVPFYVRGPPGVPAGVRRPQFALNIDIAPTLAELAGIIPDGTVDGRSLLPLMGKAAPSNWRTRFMIEAHHQDGIDPSLPGYKGVRSRTHAYTEYANGMKEAYSVQNDPKQLQSLDASNQVYDTMAEDLRALSNCKGDSCRIADVQ
jgi:N-acetylglucosamine-6-sulfatase